MCLGAFVLCLSFLTSLLTFLPDIHGTETGDLGVHCHVTALGICMQKWTKKVYLSEEFSYSSLDFIC